MSDATEKKKAKSLPEDLVHTIALDPQDSVFPCTCRIKIERGSEILGLCFPDLDALWEDEAGPMVYARLVSSASRDLGGGKDRVCLAVRLVDVNEEAWELTWDNTVGRWKVTERAPETAVEGTL